MSDNNKEIVYATFSSRMLASVIDIILSAILLIPFISLIHKYAGTTKPKLEGVNLQLLTQDQLVQILLEALPSLLLENLVFAVVIILLWIYKSATPGKMILNMKIVDAKTLEKPGKFQSVLRYFGYILSSLPLCLGFIWIHFDKKGQALHDKIAGTVVVKNNKENS